ncbi:MAG: BamA/TamA family outer membrane protein [Alphaproteobacteria bacterium]|nr:BamA/TamA family outer membrane protein [Alphaproteobacteria bacterium]
MWWGLLASAVAGDLSWYAIPNAAYDSDDGLGFGARAEIARLREGADPYLWAVTAQGFASFKGYQFLRLTLDHTQVGKARLTGQILWRQWKNDGYWGIGNGTLREREFVGTFDADDPRRKRYRYTLTSPYVHVALRYPITDRIDVFGAVSAKYSAVEPWPGSVLEEQRPRGMEGGFTTPLTAGVLYDTREPEIAPRSGVFLELSARVAPPLGGEAGGWFGPMASARGFASVGPVTFAGRVVGEWLFGAVPFYEQVHWGGLVPIAGFGGFETLRGVRFGRFRAPGKAIANAEVRWVVVEHKLGSRRLGWELAPFFDLGTVWGAGDTATAPPPRVPVHPGAGGGLRLILDGTFVGRVDYAAAEDPVLEADGSVTREWTTGFYLTFGHAF